MSVGDQIVRYREIQEIQQKELAEKIGIDAAVLNRIEKNRRPIRGDELSSIANVFGVTTDALLGRDTANLPLHVGISTVKSGKTTIPADPRDLEQACAMAVEPLLPLSDQEREHLKQYRAIGEDGRKVVDATTNSLYDQHLGKSDKESVETTRNG